MRRIATCLRNERPEPDEGTVAVLVDEGPWGFVAVDGLPDLEAAPPYRREPLDDEGYPLPSDVASPCAGDRYRKWQWTEGGPAAGTDHLRGRGLRRDDCPT